MALQTNLDLDYDLIVIGGGPAGENVADGAASRGLRVAIIESERVGGECSYWACMPSKALLRSGQALAAARRVAGADAAVTGALDVQAVLDRRTSFTSDWNDAGQADWVANAGIELVRGHGRVAGIGRVEVDGRPLTCAAVALATGSVPVLPPIDGLADVDPWGTREATSVDRVPDSLIIVGGGVAGTEMAFAFASLGSQVTLIARGGLLGQAEPFVGPLLQEGLAAAGVDVRTGVSPQRVARADDGVVTVNLSDGAEVSASELLVATGRRPQTDELGLEDLGVPLPLSVDDTLRVAGTDWLYAVGDVNGRALVTHQGKYQARAAGAAIAARAQNADVDDRAWGRHVATADHAAIPSVVFSDPEVASVGATEADARAAGTAVRTVDADIGTVAGAALHADGYAGRAKLVIDAQRNTLIGATFVGQDVAELLHSATIAIVGEVPVDRLWHAVPAYPTISEVWLRLLEADAASGGAGSA